MALQFRNVDASPTDDVRTWPYEAIVTAIERGLVTDWQALFAEIRRSPWGSVARRVERIVAEAQPEGAGRLFSLAVQRARDAMDERDRSEVAARVRAAIERSGLTAARFAQLTGTSASRLSTYAAGKVTPSAATLTRMERLAADVSSTN